MSTNFGFQIVNHINYGLDDITSTVNCLPKNIYKFID